METQGEYSEQNILDPFAVDLDLYFRYCSLEIVGIN